MAIRIEITGTREGLYRATIVETHDAGQYVPSTESREECPAHFERESVAISYAATRLAARGR